MATTGREARRPYGTASRGFCAIRLPVRSGVRRIAPRVSDNVAMTIKNIKIHAATPIDITRRL